MVNTVFPSFLETYVFFLMGDAAFCTIFSRYRICPFVGKQRIFFLIEYAFHIYARIA